MLNIKENIDCRSDGTHMCCKPTSPYDLSTSQSFLCCHWMLGLDVNRELQRPEARTGFNGPSLPKQSWTHAQKTQLSEGERPVSVNSLFVCSLLVSDKSNKRTHPWAKLWEQAGRGHMQHLEPGIFTVSSPCHSQRSCCFHAGEGQRGYAYYELCAGVKVIEDLRPLWLSSSDAVRETKVSYTLTCQLYFKNCL